MYDECYGSNTTSGVPPKHVLYLRGLKIALGCNFCSQQSEVAGKVVRKRRAKLCAKGGLQCANIDFLVKGFRNRCIKQVAFYVLRFKFIPHSYH